MRYFFLGVIVGLFLAVAGASAYWAVGVERHAGTIAGIMGG